MRQGVARRLLLIGGKLIQCEECVMSEVPAGAVPVAPARSKLLVIVICSLLAAGAAGGGVFYLVGNQDPAPEQAASAAGVKRPAIYRKFDPPFVVNFENKGMMRF